MGLKCDNCGSTDTITTKKSNLDRVAPKGGLGMTIDPILIRELIQFLLIGVAVIIPFLKNKLDPLYVVCKKCGSYKRID